MNELIAFSAVAALSDALLPDGRLCAYARAAMGMIALDMVIGVLKTCIGQWI